jgi:serine/threonine protein kinase
LIAFVLPLLAAAVNPQSGPVFWGTLVYVAPEVAIAGAGAYSISSDWWSVGVLMYELLLGLVPWDAPDDDGILEQIKQGDVLWPPEGLVSSRGWCLECAQHVACGSRRTVIT